MFTATENAKKGKGLTKGQLARMKKPDSCENLLQFKPSKKRNWVHQLDIKCEPNSEASINELKKAYK